MLSNGLSALEKAITLLAAATTQTAPATGPATTAPAADSLAQAPPFIIALVAVGTVVLTVVLAVWVIRLLIRPGKMALSRAPGRPNRLTPVQVLALLLAWLGLSYGTAWLLQRISPFDEIQCGLLGNLAGQAVLLAACLAVAAGTFQHGLRRGLGLSARHYIFDTLRGVIGYLAVLPVCVGLLEISRRIVSTREHPMLTALEELGPGWQILVVVSAVILAPLSEEIFFRGLAQSMLRRVLPNPWSAIVVTSALFAVVHSGAPQSVAPIFALSVVLGYNYERTGRLLPSILIHVLFNAIFILAKLVDIS